MTVDEDYDFVRTHGVVLASAKGAVPRLTEAIANGPITGSWWSHPQSHRIFAILEAVTAHDDILVCRVVDGKVSLVHRRLWPALVCVANRLVPAHIAKLREEHTATGKHKTHEVPFPQWVPDDVMQAAQHMDEAAALAALGSWTQAATPRPSTRGKRST